MIPVELITVYVGHVNLVFLHSSSLYAVEIAIAHPKFVGVGGGYDIALIQLKNEINFKSSSSSCVCQLKPHGTYDRSTCYAIGWGATSYENRKPSFFLRHVMLPVLEDSYCSTHSKHYVYNPKIQLCAGFEKGESDSCVGDSGGPLLCLTSKEHFTYALVGLVSYGFGCAQAHSPGYYTKVSYFLDWIKKQTGC